jgi:hypothetical protein
MKLRELYEAPGATDWAADVFGDFYKDEEPPIPDQRPDDLSKTDSPDIPKDRPIGTGNVRRAMDFFVRKGLTVAQAAGLVGNLQAESGPRLDINAVGDGGRAKGIAQWHPDRRRNFERWKRKPFSQSTFQEQLDFIWWELTNTESRALRKLRAATTPAEAAEVVDQFYERSSGQHRQKRIEYANLIASSGRSYG